MIFAIGLGLLGVFALRRARRHACHGGGNWGGPPWRMHHGRAHSHRRNHRRRWMFHAALQRIDATPAQERLIVGELDKLADRMRDARHRLHEARGDLATAIRSPQLDDTALAGVLGRVDHATSEARAASLEALRAVHAALDDKQRAELADLIDRRGGGWWRSGPYR
jgi:uncharacterized membrane protein